MSYEKNRISRIFGEKNDKKIRHGHQRPNACLVGLRNRVDKKVPESATQLNQFDVQEPQMCPENL